MTENMGAPDFVGVGAQRSGTSWWFALIGSHPGVDVRAKELHFFDRFWTEPFSDESVRSYHAQFVRQPGTQSGEWTPRYMYDPWTPELLRRAAPQAKLLAILRDPIERFRSGMALWLTRYADEFSTGAMDAFHRGLYAAQLNRLFEWFPREQVLVLQYERCVADPATELARTYGFLGLDDSFRPDDLARPVNEGPTTADKPRLTNVMLEMMTDRYREDCELLVRLVPELDTGLWPFIAADR